MTSIEVAIEYFVKKKFGVLSTMTKMLSGLDAYKNSDFSKQASEIIEYERTLRNMHESELLTLHKQSLANDTEQHKRYVTNEENARFYNLPSASADFLHWGKTEHWTIDEAIALSFGKEPKVVTWKLIELLQDKTDFAKAFSKRRDLAMRSSKLKNFNNSIPPIYFMNWAEELDIKVSTELINEVAKYVGMPINWHQKFIEVRAELDLLLEQSSSTPKPESTRKSENLLQALTCIAIDEYGYTPESEKSTAPKEIAEALNRQGKAIDPKTIRAWLKEGFELLPAKPYKD